MSSEYKKGFKKKGSKLISFLEKIYLRIFGIPEIGFQLRGQYFTDMLKKNIRTKKPERILDAGSGIGAYTFWLSKKYNVSIVDGWEIDETKLDFSKKFAKELNINNVNFSYGDITEASLKNKNKYNLIVNIDVLEHIDNFKGVLRNFYQLLAKGGYLYIHTPQINQQRIFQQTKGWHHDEHLHEGFSPIDLKKELIAIGFKIIEARETFGTFGKIAWELDHVLLSKGFVVSGIAYPFLYLISRLDLLTKNKRGLGTAILAKK
jgi:2-polyprenyl-3-methyl-5-hydroxy-6-metoxy-1,4-benzoquinol methylase